MAATLLMLPTGLVCPELLWAIIMVVLCWLVIYLITKSYRSVSNTVDDASVSKIIEDTRKRTSASRSPPDGSTSNSFELESPRAVVEAQQIRSTSSVQLDKCRISPEHNYDEEKVILEDDGAETRIRTTHREEVDGNASKSFTKTTAVTQRSSPRGAEEKISSSSVTTVSQRSSSSRGGTPKSDSPGKDPSSHSIARVGRSGSVKALQQRFQQAAG
jgi:hypothetical protein